MRPSGNQLLPPQYCHERSTDGKIFAAGRLQSLTAVPRAACFTQTARSRMTSGNAAAALNPRYKAEPLAAFGPNGVKPLCAFAAVQLLNANPSYARTSSSD